MSHTKNYITPTIETLESNEILDLIGPVQGYGYGSQGGGGADFGISSQLVPLGGPRTPSAN